MAKAVAHPNIALIKYWGKRDQALNLPAVGSISLTLDSLRTETSVMFTDTLREDRVSLNGEEPPDSTTSRISRFLDLIRDRAGIRAAAEVHTSNNFPTGAGLASSASGFAALALAGSAAANLSLSPRELSVLARQGSGSAARSIFGGWVEMQKGEREDGTDAQAEQLFDEEYWDLRMLIVVLSSEQKLMSSTAGMTHTANTSPFYSSWVRKADHALSAMRNAIAHRDFHEVGRLCEASALRLHALTLSADPGIVYWTGETVALIHTIRRLRERGIPVYFTIDAGPQVKLLCFPDDVTTIQEALAPLEGILDIIITAPGQGAQLGEDCE